MKVSRSSLAFVLLVLVPGLLVAGRPERTDHRRLTTASTVRSASVPQDPEALRTAFAEATSARKLQLARQLSAEGAGGITRALRLAAGEADASVQQKIVAQLRWKAREHLARAIGEGDDALVVSLVGALHAANDAAALRDGSFLVGVGLDDAPSSQALLHRLNGDLDGALTAVSSADAPGLTESLLIESAGWAELADRSAGEATKSGDTWDVGFAAMAARLAGDPSRQAEWLAVLESRAATPSDDDLTLAKALLLNDRPDAALAPLVRAGEVDVAFHVLTRLKRFGEAIALADSLASRGDLRPETRLTTELGAARLFASFGQRDVAADRLAEIARNAAPELRAHSLAQVVSTAASLGLRDEAFGHAAAFIDQVGDDGRPEAIAAAPFLRQRVAAEAAWRWHRAQDPAANTMTILRRVQDLLEGPDAARQVAELLVDGADFVADLPSHQQGRWLEGLAMLAGRHGHSAEQLAVLERWADVRDTAHAWSRLGDGFRAEGRFRDAADAYWTSWERNPREATPLYLRGRALMEAGLSWEGGESIRQSLVVPMGDAGARYRLAAAMQRERDGAGAEEQRELVIILGEPTNAIVSWGHQSLARQASCAEATVGLSGHWERARAQLFVGAPKALSARAIAFLADRAIDAQAADAAVSGDVSAAVRFADAPWLNHVDIAADYVLALEARGHDREADELATRLLAVHAQAANEVPGAARLHNAQAWFAARTHRDLGAALAAAERAVELAPRSAGFLDTLAEVYFQVGQRERAAELMADCVKLAPGQAYFAAQAQRFATGDPLTPPAVFRR